MATLIPALPFCHAELRASKPKPTHYPKQVNTLGDQIRARRLDLNLLQRQVAEQIGVDEATVHNWEGNKSAPALRYIPAIIRLLGFDPLPPSTSLAERLLSARREFGLSQRKMAARLGVDPATLQGWEVGQHQPTKKNLDVIARTLRERIHPT